MEGRLFSYGKGLSAFISGCNESSAAIVLIGGLSDGFLTIPYTKFLGGKLKDLNISLVQLVLRSSYSAYGTHTLQDDLDDIQDLLLILSRDFGKQKLILLGHSTGCQDIMWLCSHWGTMNDDCKKLIIGGILQAPVSDREYAASENPKQVEEILKWAETNSRDSIRIIDGIPTTDNTPSCEGPIFTTVSCNVYIYRSTKF